MDCHLPADASKAFLSVVLNGVEKRIGKVASKSADEGSGISSPNSDLILFPRYLHGMTRHPSSPFGVPTLVSWSGASDHACSRRFPLTRCLRHQRPPQHPISLRGRRLNPQKTVHPGTATHHKPPVTRLLSRHVSNSGQRYPVMRPRPDTRLRPWGVNHVKDCTAHPPDLSHPRMDLACMKVES
jgi:hypothetical protein